MDAYGLLAVLLSSLVYRGYLCSASFCCQNTFHATPSTIMEDLSAYMRHFKFIFLTPFAITILGTQHTWLQSLYWANIFSSYSSNTVLQVCENHFNTSLHWPPLLVTQWRSGLYSLHFVHRACAHAYRQTYMHGSVPGVCCGAVRPMTADSFPWQ